jgi:hypothetical protein
MLGRGLVLVGLLLGVACQPTTSGQPAGEARQDSQGDANGDVVAYAELCKSELGITGPLPAMSCLAGREIPITVDGKPLDDTSFGHLVEGGGCDKPHWLGESCYPYDIIQRVEIGGDVDAVLNCRQVHWVNHADPGQRRHAYEQASAGEKLTRFRDLAEFDDLALILRNRQTGKICYFTIFGQTTYTDHAFYGGWLPPPDAAKLPPMEDVRAQIADPKPPSEYPVDAWYRDARATYFKPSDFAETGGCIGCHDLGGFKHSPFIDQSGIVPSNGRLPFLPVGEAFQVAFRKQKLIDVTTEPIDGKPQWCTTCHRMTSGGRTCDTMIDYATAWSTGGSTSDLPLSGWARTYPQAAWMPFGHGMKTAEDYQRAFGQHITRMKCCCKHPQALGCLSRPFGPTREELGDVAAGELLAPFAPASPDAAETCL